ncbi:hypothetical protein V6C27_14465 [Peptococcaceae bacterium 1198_IL3148]
MHRHLLTLLLSTLLFCLLATPVFANGSVILVVTDRMSIYDLNNEELTGFKKIVDEGAMGLLNCNTAGSMLPVHTYNTIGAGSQVFGTAYANKAFSVNTQLEEGFASEIYQQRTGITPPANSIVQLGLPRMELANNNLPRTVEMGAIGTALHQAGLKTAIFGNSDLTDELGRLAVSIAMDNKGIVDDGLIGNEILISDPQFPGGKHTDYEKLIKEVKTALNDHQFVVVQLGDTERLYQLKNDIFPEVYKKYFQQSIQRADSFLNELTNSMNNNDMLIFLSPTPDETLVAERKRLTPVIIWEKGNINAGPSILESGTTKHPGIVMSTDIAATILNYFDLPISSKITGRPIYTVPAEYNPVEFLQDKQDQLAVTYDARTPLQQGYVAFQIVILAVSLYMIFISKKGANLLKPAILFVVSVPLTYLLLPLLPNPSVPIVAFELILFAAVITIIVTMVGRGNFMNSFALLATLTAAMLIIDILLGQPLQKQSILSYDPMVGARFYGIGNEYMGVLNGSLIMATAFAVNKFEGHRKTAIIISGIIFAITIHCMAAPNLGTNVGGTIAASSAFLVTFLLFTGVKFRPKVIVGIIIAVVLLLLSFIAFDLSRPIQQQSHIGQTARLIIEGGFTETINIISRKLAMNMKLVRYTVWTRVLLAIIVVLAILFYKPKGIMAKIKSRYPYLFKGFIGLVTGALVAFAFNDSGVVAAATTMIFGAPPLIYLVLKETNKRGI